MYYFFLKCLSVYALQKNVLIKKYVVLCFCPQSFSFCRPKCKKPQSIQFVLTLEIDLEFHTPLYDRPLTSRFGPLTINPFNVNHRVQVHRDHTGALWALFSQDLGAIIWVAGRRAEAS